MNETVKWLDEACTSCGGQMNSWDKRLTNTFKVRNTCEKCFCKIYDLETESFRKRMVDFFGIRPCQGI